MALTPLKIGTVTNYASAGGTYDSASITALPNNCALLMYGHWVSSNTSVFPFVTVWETVAQVVSFDETGWTLHATTAFDWASHRWEVDFTTTVTGDGHVLIMTSRNPLRGYRLLEINYTAMTVTAHAPVSVQVGPTTGTTSPSAYAGINTWGQQGARLAGTDDFVFVRTLEVPVGFSTKKRPFAEAVRVTGTTVTVLDAVQLPEPASFVNTPSYYGRVFPVGSSALAMIEYTYASSSSTNPHVYRFWSLGIAGGALTVKSYDLPVPADPVPSHLSSYRPLSLLYSSPSTYDAELIVKDNSNTQWGMQRWGLSLSSSGASGPSSFSVSTTPLPLDQLDLTARPDGAAAGSTLVLGSAAFEPAPRFTVADTTLLVTIPAALVNAGVPDRTNRLMIAQFDLTTGARGDVAWDVGSTGLTGPSGPVGSSSSRSNGEIHVADAYLPALGQYVVAAVDTTAIGGFRVKTFNGTAVEDSNGLGYPAGNIRLLDYTLNAVYPMNQQLRSTGSAFI